MYPLPFNLFIKTENGNRKCTCKKDKWIPFPTVPTVISFTYFKTAIR